MKLFSRRKDQNKDETNQMSSSPEIRVAIRHVTSPLGRIMLRPVVTEKSAHLASLGKYVFEVAPGANRVLVRQAVSEIYGMRPKAVHIQNVRGEEVRVGRHIGKRKSWKKAIVTLPKGQKIDVYEGV